MLSARFILTLSFTLIAIALSGCRTEYIEQPGAEATSTNPGVSSMITKPGVVAVDASARRLELTEADALDMCLPTSGHIKPDIMHKVKMDPDVGLDERYLRISTFFRRAGSACLQGNAESCHEIQLFSLDWARNSRLRGPRGGEDDDHFWEHTLSINMRLLNPMMAALGVAEQFSPLSASERAVLDPWLKRKVDQYEHDLRGEGYYSGGKDGTTARKAANNHAVQSSIAAMSYGAWSGDESYFKTGIEQWHITLRSMRKDGSLPVETRRGARALFYHGRTTAALMQLAERAAVQGIDLHSMTPSPSKNIHQAVKFFIDAIEEPDIVMKYAKANRYPGPQKNYKIQDLGADSTFGWVSVYMARFPDHPNTQRLLPRKSWGHSETTNYLTLSLDSAIRSRLSNEWIGVDSTCFYGNPEIFL